MQPPEWLDSIINKNKYDNLPLIDILNESLYYPASGLNGGSVAKLQNGLS